MSNPSTKGLSRLAYQFENSTKLRGFLDAFLQQYNDLQTSELQLLNERYLNVAIGVQLDGIGEIVGLPRPEKDIDVVGAFGFLDDTTALGFGTLTDPTIGGNFIRLGDTKTLIDDTLYRLLIRAKIIKNQTAMTVDDTLRLISFTFSGVKVRYFLSENLKPRYDIGKFLDAFEADLVNDFPVLIGIDEVEYHSYSETTPFGFDGDPDVLGFGTLTDPDIGGNFSTIL